MDKLTCDLQGVAIYMDDILVGGANSREHLRNLKALLQRLRDKGLKCNKNKCNFANDSIEYLGLVISKNGIEKGKRVDALIKMPTPSELLNGRQFRGKLDALVTPTPHIVQRRQNSENLRSHVPSRSNIQFTKGRPFMLCSTKRTS